MKNLKILVAGSVEELQALADEKGYAILCQHKFDSLDTDTLPIGAYGHIQSGSRGVVAIARAG